MEHITFCHDRTNNRILAVWSKQILGQHKRDGIEDTEIHGDILESLLVLHLSSSYGHPSYRQVCQIGTLQKQRLHLSS